MPTVCRCRCAGAWPSPAASLLAAEGNTADFDAEKVARIAQAIRDGKFEVNAGAIADKLLDGSRELIRRH